MKTKFTFVKILMLILVVSACSPLTNTNSSSEPLTPVIEGEYQPVTVDHVEVQVGVGSPIPVHAIVSGNLPDTCAQIEYTEIKRNGSNFSITLSTIPSSSEDCIQDALPFRMSIPLNMIDLPPGSYSVEVNSSRADFRLDTGNTASSLSKPGSALTKVDVQVDSVNVQVGVGSPIPVHAVVGLSLPSTCAQLGEIRLHRDGKTFFVRLIADVSERPDCISDSISFRLEIPLNTVNMPAGPYEVNVNGVMTSFDPNTIPADAPVQPIAELNLIQVDHVGIQVGVGSPIPVEIIASGTWPDLCSQIASVESKMDGFNMDITVLASTAESCRPDQLGLPFRFAIPLNIVEMEAGTYTITVNGMSTSFELPLSP